MAKFNDAHRGRAFTILERDNFVCTYCGWDCKIWPNWLYLSWDHLLPIGHPHRYDSEYIVAACIFCIVLNNHAGVRRQREDASTASGPKETTGA